MAYENKMKFLLCVCLALGICSCATPSKQDRQPLSDYTTAQLRLAHQQVLAEYTASVSGTQQQAGKIPLSSIDSFNIGAQDQPAPSQRKALQAERRRIENELIRRFESGDTEARYW